MLELLLTSEIIEAETRLEKFAKSLIVKSVVYEGLSLETAIDKVERMTSTKINLGCSRSSNKRRLKFQHRQVSQQDTEYPFCLWVKLARSKHDSFLKNSGLINI